MPNLEERLEAVVAQSEVDGSKWHTIVHGDDMTTVQTESGNVPSVAKQLKDVRAEIINGLEDYVGECRQAKADTLQIKSETQTIKGDTNTIKGQTKTLRDEAETFKDLSQTTYNSIASATAASISQVLAEGAVQVALATAQAERALAYAQNAAPTPLGTKLTVPASSKVPDGYEPVWYKNTITRARYPDFFTQLVDTNSLVLVDEETYDSQVATYGMCASYVKVDNNTLILPLLVNFARGGTPNQLGSVQNDQMQGHWHEMVYRQDSISSGYRSDIFGTDGFTASGYSNTGGTDEWMQRLGNRKNDALCAITPITDNTNGTPRVGAETRPKAYYELTYIKCADVSRTIAMEETSEITLNSFCRTTWENPDPKVVLYSLYKFAEKCGNYYQFTLSRLLDHTIESDGISPTEIFGLDRETMEKILNGLSVNYPDFISASFTLDLDNITLKSDKTSEDVLQLF